MRNHNNTNESYSSISATFLSIVTTVFGLSNLKLNIWWHFLLSFVVLCVMYALFFCLINMVSYIYVQKLKLPSLKTDSKEKLHQLCTLSSQLYEKLSIYNSITDDSWKYKEILIYELKKLNINLENEIRLIQNSNRIMKDKYKIEISEYDLERYKNFNEEIKNILSSSNDSD